MILRPYQEAAICAVYEFLRTKMMNPCIVAPTGCGKSLLIATICHDAVTKWSGRVLVLAHVKELLEQTASTLRRIAPDLEVGVYSAGLGKRDTNKAVIVAGIQSVYKKACDLDRFDLIIVDECHLLPPDGEGMYQTFFRDAKVVNPNVRLIGLTATPYRLKSGMLCGPKNLLNEVCYEIGVKELIEQGFLCPLKSKSGRHKVDCGGLHVRAGEFVACAHEHWRKRRRRLLGDTVADQRPAFRTDFRCFGRSCAKNQRNYRTFVETRMRPRDRRHAFGGT